MHYKLKSVKLWLTIALIIGAGYLNHAGTLTGDQLVDFTKWALALFIVGNVGSKVTSKGDI